MLTCLFKDKIASNPNILFLRPQILTRIVHIGLLRSTVRYRIMTNEHLQLYSASNFCYHTTPFLRSSSRWQHKGLTFDLVPLVFSFQPSCSFSMFVLDLPESACGCEDLSEGRLNKCYLYVPRMPQELGHRGSKLCNSINYLDEVLTSQSTWDHQNTDTIRQTVKIKSLSLSHWKNLMLLSR